MNTGRVQSGLRIAMLIAIVAAASYAQTVPGRVDAAYGVVPGRRDSIKPRGRVVFRKVLLGRSTLFFTGTT
jgi:hypothetical protein